MPVIRKGESLIRITRRRNAMQDKEGVFRDAEDPGKAWLDYRKAVFLERLKML